MAFRRRVLNGEKEANECVGTGLGKFLGQKSFFSKSFFLSQGCKGRKSGHKT